MSGAKGPVSDGPAIRRLDSFMDQIYNKFNELFGQGKQEIFQLEFPARLLEKGNYHYVGSDTINAQQSKPQAVVDAEFRLSDDMYSISRFVAGPRGSKVSNSYAQVINQLVPCSSSDSGMARVLVPDQGRIINWLDEEVPDWEPAQTDILGAIPAQYEEQKPKELPVPRIDSNVTSMERTTALVVRNPGAVDRNTTVAAIRKVPRIDLYQKLLNVYETQRFRWAEFKRKSRPGENATAFEIDAYNRMLAIYAPIVNAQLESLWTMLLIRGQYHRVRRYIGFVDVESASETIQAAKENLRSSVMRSIDDTQDVYPIYFQPSNWATHLDTNFKPQDLLSSESVVRERLHDKEKQRALLIFRRSALESGATDLKTLKVEEVEARGLYLAAQKALTTGYSDTAVQIIELYFDTITKTVTNKVAAVRALAKADDPGSDLCAALVKASLPPIGPAEFKKLASAQAECLDRQFNLQTAAEALSRTSLAVTAARGSDTSALLTELNQQIEALTIDITYVKNTLSGSSNPLGVPVQLISSDGARITEGDGGKASENGRMPDSIKIPPQEEGASIWQEIVIECTKSDNKSADTSVNSSSRSDTTTGFLLGSFSTSETSQSAASGSMKSAANTSIKIGCRVMKVVINRPWMDAGILSQSKEFYFANSTDISVKNVNEVLQALDTNLTGQDLTKANDVIDAAEKAMLPTWPVAFIVVKDLHIIAVSDSNFQGNEAADLQKRLDSGGGFLCFSSSKSENAQEHRTAAAVQFDGNRLSIKIPAPQIIGWVSHFCPKDEAQDEYVKLAEDEFKPPPKPGQEIAQASSEQKGPTNVEPTILPLSKPTAVAAR